MCAEPGIDEVAVPARSLAIVGGGPWGITAREGALKIREGARMLAEGFDTDRLLHGGAVPLTNLELRLLYYLMNRPGQIVTIEELNQKVWGYSAEADNTMLKNVVYRLRRKIETDPHAPRFLLTVYGVGYRFSDA